MIEIFNNDCFDVFPEIEDNSIDLFLLDLPYANKKFGNCTSLAWDTPIDLDKMWVEIKRMMKPNAIIVFFCNTKFGCSLINSNPKWYRYDLVWEKSKKVGFLSANKMPLRKHENIYIFKDELGVYHPQKTERETDYKHTGKRSSEEHYSGKIDCKKIYKKEDGMFPTSVMPEFETTILQYKNPHGKTIHRTQKPVDLCEWLIKTYSNEDDTVMDFTMGSGTVGVACKNTNRKFIGIEKDEDIFNLAEDRLKKC